MKTRQEMDAGWADLSKRLESDCELAKVVESIDRALGDVANEEPRRRLKVPYANANSLEKGNGWKQS
jgi:hypothetical protein